MKTALAIENIEEVRRRQGIVDTALKADIARLKPGDAVKLSLETDGRGYETITVRLTSARGGVLRGRLVKKPKAPGLKELDVGTLIRFETAHVHSIVGRGNSAMSMDRSLPMPTRAELLREARIEADFECERPFPRIQRSKRPAVRRKTRRLRVEGNDRERFIQAPVDQSHELRSFLRANRIRSNPPQPYFDDCDRIQLGEGSDPLNVQKLLDVWTARHRALGGAAR